MSPPPLVVDLDGSLLRSDLLLESGLAFLKSQPLSGFSPLLWLLSGKAHLKQRLAHATEIASDVIALIQRERALGRQIILATASHVLLAEQVAGHLQLFDRVMATDGDINLSAHKKRDRLISEFGEQGFDHVGNSLDDLPVWAKARHAYVINPEPGVEARVRNLGNVTAVIKPARSSVKLWLKELRWYQWLKNLLLFVPLPSNHELERSA